MMSSASPLTITGVILAGGRGRRMAGQDKGLVQFNEHTLIEAVIQRLAPQVDTLLINANRNQSRYTELTGYPVITDELDEYQGPLAGMLAGLQAASTELVVFVPCDSPCLADCLVARLYQALLDNDAEMSVAHDGERLQPVFALLRQTLHTDLTQFLATGERKIDRWYAQHTMATGDFADLPDSFININTSDELRLTGDKLRTNK